ncbi:MAG TPA: hypothetical protein VM581_02635, partial [Magnetospirillaceae bacterium]|nr:hypothetical protein [Magnetospirillaceae bacterium]
MRGTRGGLPLLIMALLAGSALLILVGLLPFVQFNRNPAVATPQPQPSPPPKTLCLQRLAPFHHFGLPVDPEGWGPGQDVKHGKYDFGPSAVPTGIDQLTPADAMTAVKQIYIR